MRFPKELVEFMERMEPQEDKVYQDDQEEEPRKETVVNKMKMHQRGNKKNKQYMDP